MIRSLPAAVKAAIAHGNTVADLRLTAWAATFHCGVEDVRLAWEAEMSRQALAPINSYEVEGK